VDSIAVRSVSPVVRSVSPQMAAMNVEIDSEYHRVADALAAQPSFAPPMSVKDMGETTEFHVDVPGASMDDLCVDLQDGILTISGRREQASSVADGNSVATEDAVAVENVCAMKQDTVDTCVYNIKGRNLCKFSYNINITKISSRFELSTQSVKARLDNGVLVVTVPKSARSVSLTRRNSQSTQA